MLLRRKHISSLRVLLTEMLAADYKRQELFELNLLANMPPPI